MKEASLTDQPAAVWDRLVASALSQANTPTAERPSGRKPLELVGRPTRKHLLTVFRSVGMIHADLRRQIRLAVTGEAPWPLFVHGPAGTGKSCAALCLLDYAAFGGEYFSTPGLCETVTRSQQGRLEWSHEGRGGTLWPEQFWKRMASAALVVMDELGCREKVTDHHYECVKRLIDDRHGKPLVVLSNLDLETLTVLYDDRVASRLAAGTVVMLEGDDRRLSP